MPEPPVTQAPNHASWSAIPPEPMNPLLTRQFVSGSQGMVARLILKKGCVVPTHSHPNEQIAYVVSGALEFLLGDPATPTSYIVRSGELLVIPGTVLHSAIALEDTEDIDFFAPPRQDWLNGSDAYLRESPAPQTSSSV